MVASQGNSNLFLYLHLNISSLRSLSSSLRSLGLIILFFIDTQVAAAIEAIRGWRLPDYFPLYLSGGGFSPWSLTFQKYLDRVVWFLSRRSEKEFCGYTVFVFNSQQRYKTSPHHYYVPWGKCTLGIRRASNYIVCPRQGIPLFFYSYRLPHLVSQYSYLIRLVTCFCGCFRFYAYCL